MTHDLAVAPPTSSTAPLARIRDDFPSLASGFAHFDGPGGTQTPRQVAEAIAATLMGPLSNRGSGSPSERNAEAVVTAFRAAMADYLDADPAGIVYGRSATQLTYDVARTLAKGWGPGDEVVVTRLDHDANVRPWVQAAEAKGATVRFADFDADSAELRLEHVEAVLSPRTRLVALTAASNLLGSRPPVRAIAQAARAVGALSYLDAVHAAAHAALSLPALGVDFLVCSPYKFLGPHCGVLAAAPELLDTLPFDKLLPATDRVPERFELGTLPYETMAGVTAAVDYLAGLAPAEETANPEAAIPERDGAMAVRRRRLENAFHAIEAHEDGLRHHIEAGLAALPGLRSWSRAADRTPTLLVTFDGRDASSVYRSLLERHVLAPAGSFYALEASRRLGLGEAGGLRVGLAPYNTLAEADRLLQGLSEVCGTVSG